MHLLKTLVLGMFFLCAWNTSSFAQEHDPLTDNDVRSFLGSQKVLEPLAAEMEQNGVEDFFKPRLHMVEKNMPLYVNNVEDLKKNHPAYYKRMTEIVSTYSYDDKRHFPTAEAWAKNADRVMMTHFAATSTATKTGHKDMAKRISPQMLAMLPAESRAQFQSTLDFMKSLQDVTKEDKETVLKYEDEIMAHLINYQSDSPIVP
ncbi:MAG: hypothetical protein ACRBDL_09880 [Alphaproteobacteria bacterium]